MNYKPENLIQGKFYHVFNRGNNGQNIFFDTANYYHFLKLYEQYIYPVAETYAWCLLKNHFHALVYIRSSPEIKLDKLHYSTVEKPRHIDASKQFSHFFNAYTQSIKRYKRTGSLFEKPFKRKQVVSEKFFQNLISYIHNNPVHHGFAEKAIEYPWSSYESVLSESPTKLDRKFVLSAFGGRNSFVDYHNQKQDLNKISTFIIE